ncbi:MAG: vegetative protein [Deltaproteobacteria bacterium]|nr:vegetative protein [Deltaproteobacteria bacterium]MBI4373842.1 vegetative protein [Deltaproteobacteria bacterium]
MEAKKCKAEGCKRPYRAKDYCNVHYKKWRHGELPHRRYKTCHHEGCKKPMTKWGLCEEHYKAKAGVKEAVPAPAAPSTDAAPPA